MKKLRIVLMALSAAIVASPVAAQAAVITGWSFDTAPYSAPVNTGSVVASNVGPVAGNGYEIGFTNSVTNPGTSATYTYDSVNAAGNYVNLTATVDTTIHPLNSNAAVTGNTATNDILSTPSADNGHDALLLLQKSPVDLVITDMQMPELDGLELVKAIRKADSLTPIILVTAHGSEELAMKALRAGASSYVPKKQIPRDLSDTIEQVLALAASAKDQRTAVTCLVSANCSLVLPNDCEAVGPVIHYLRGEAARMDICDDTQLTHLTLALDEAFANAIDHGNLEVSSDLREPEISVYLRTIQERRHQSPYAARRVHVSASFSRDAAHISIRDEGPGFDYRSMPDPTSPDNLTKTSGRGLFLIHTFADEVLYNTSGNEITLIKRRSDNQSQRVESELHA